jgi:tetratricopeptide (TPR) repeat protein
MLALAACVLVMATIVGCGGKSDFEKGKELYDKGLYEQAMPFLEKAKSGDTMMQADQMIRDAKVKMEEEADRECVRKAENFMDLLQQAKTIQSWDQVVADFKSFRCRTLETKPYIDKAYYNFVQYLAKWDAYPKAVDKFCEFTGCEAQPPHMLIREEEIKINDEQGKEKTETIQQEIPIAQHDIAMTMFKWLMEKDQANARWFDRYAKFLYDLERYKEAREAYQAIAETEGVGYEVKSRAKLTVEHLDKGKVRRAGPDDSYRFFWIEEAKQKSKVKGLLKELEAARKEKEEAERKQDAAQAN